VKPVMFCTFGENVDAVKNSKVEVDVILDVVKVKEEVVNETVGKENDGVEVIGF
jgi:hypothetical protein